MRKLPGGRVTFTISLGIRTFDQVERAAKREGVSMAEIVRRALDVYFSLASNASSRHEDGEET